MPVCLYAFLFVLDEGSIYEQVCEVFKHCSIVLWPPRIVCIPSSLSGMLWYVGYMYHMYDKSYQLKSLYLELIATTILDEMTKILIFRVKYRGTK